MKPTWLNWSELLLVIAFPPTHLQRAHCHNQSNREVMPAGFFHGENKVGY